MGRSLAPLQAFGPLKPRRVCDPSVFISHPSTALAFLSHSSSSSSVGQCDTIETVVGANIQARVIRKSAEENLEDEDDETDENEYDYWTPLTPLSPFDISPSSFDISRE
jgi:hypothetical protein